MPSNSLLMSVHKPRMSTRQFEQFKREQRLDLFCADILEDNDKMHDLWTVVKMILTLFCGNAAVEGGFSINKELLIDNMTEETIVSQRVVFDVIHAAGMVVSKVEIISKLIASVRVRQANAQYKMALQAKQLQQTEEEAAREPERENQSLILLNNRRN